MKIDTRYNLDKLMKFYNLPMIAAEVGVAEGRWSQTLFDFGMEKLYLIDIWERVPFIPGCGGFEQEWHDKNYERVKSLFGDKKNVTLLKGFSYKMAEQIPDGSLGLAYIDAGHDYYSVKADLETFWPKVAPGGIIGLHDYINPDYQVWKAAKEFAAEKNAHINLLIEDGEVVNMGGWLRK